jgi:hypothetical protein
VRRGTVPAALGTVAFLVALALAGGSRGLALYGYVLFLALLALAALAAAVRTSATGIPRAEQLLSHRPEPSARVPQLEALAGRLAGGRANAFDLHDRLRPLVREIAASRLARRHGVDLARRPERARAILGPRTWDLARPDREPPEDRFGRGLQGRELERLVDELEAI